MQNRRLTTLITLLATMISLTYLGAQAESDGKPAGEESTQRRSSQENRKPNRESVERKQEMERARESKTETSGKKNDYSFNKTHPILGFLLLVALVVACVFWVIGQFMLLIASFKTSISWGLACLLLPFVAIFYICTHWREASTAVIFMLIGAVTFAVSAGGSVLVQTLVDHAG
jgi:hypothetical protein